MVPCIQIRKGKPCTCVNYNFKILKVEFYVKPSKTLGEKFHALIFMAAFKFIL